jgi:DNA-binding XRE family transcriptional regulator
MYRFRNRVAEMRGLRGLTLTELARLAGVTRPTLYKVEADPYYPASTETILALATALRDRLLFVLDPNGAGDETP